MLVPAMGFAFGTVPPDTIDHNHAPWVIGGLGVTLVNAPSVTDYINRRYNPSERLDDFGVAVEFFGAFGARIHGPWAGKIEYAYLLRTYNLPDPSFGIENTFAYGIHMPTLLAQYVLAGTGYAVKLGGGLGYHVATFTEEIVLEGKRSYTSRGLGLKAEAEGNTAFDEHFFGYIGVDLRANVMTEFKTAEGRRLVISPENDNAGMSFFGIGLKFGFVYYF
jgi:hypothetical protein